jgi:hypothetical protein
VLEQLPQPVMRLAFLVLLVLLVFVAHYYP